MALFSDLIGRGESITVAYRLVFSSGDDEWKYKRIGLKSGLYETDFTDDLMKIDIPTLIIHGE